MKKLNAATLVREMARERIGTVPVTRLVPDKRRRKDKHGKRELARRLED